MVANPSGLKRCSKDHTRGRAGAGGYFWAG
jgi:hypothetical protein